MKHQITSKFTTSKEVTDFVQMIIKEHPELHHGVIARPTLLTVSGVYLFELEGREEMVEKYRKLLCT